MDFIKHQSSYDYFIIIDFEATCDNNDKLHPREIIEFPALKVNAKTLEIEDSFSRFVKPVHHPTLSKFCKELTTITQENVNNADEFKVVLKEFDEWMKEKVGLDKRILMITHGDWDLKIMLPQQCRVSNVAVPYYCKTWCNIIRSFHIYKKRYTVRDLTDIVEALDLKFIGTNHRGIDDCNNIVNVMRSLHYYQCSFLPTYYAGKDV